MPQSVGLMSLATAEPPFELCQDEIARAAQGVFADRMPQHLRLMPVFRNSGIRRRQAVRPMSWYRQALTWPTRTEAYLDAGLALYEQAAARALEEAGIAGSDIDIAVTVSSTGIATPSLEARAMPRLGLRPDVVRVPVFGLGCAGGATGLALAARLARATPGATVLLVALELCTLSFRLDDASSADIVAMALFGDGAAACVLQAGGEGFCQLSGFAEHTWPDTLQIMGWRADPTGLGVIFTQDIPAFARRRLRAAMDQMLAPQGLAVADVDRFICHPGGMKVIEALEAALDLGQGALDAERQILAEHGNMSAPTVLYVLDRLRRRGLPNRTVLTALGPGFTASTVTLEAA